MSNSRLAALAERKALLSTRAELDRTRVSFAVHGIREIVAPPASAERLARVRPLAAILVGLASPMVGAPRLARWLRIASLALAVYRIARHWKRSEPQLTP